MTGSGAARHGVVLAGGAGSRLGGVKPLAELGGRPLIDHPLAAMRAAGLTLTIVAKSDSDLPPVTADVSVIREPDEPRHALLGIVTALETLAEPIVVSACDMPFVTGALLAWIAGIEADVAVPRNAETVDPMLGRYAPAALAALRTSMESGRSARAGVEAAGFRAIDRRELAKFGDPDRLLFDVDTAEELALATQMLARGAPSTVLGDPVKRGIAERT